MRRANIRKCISRHVRAHGINKKILLIQGLLCCLAHLWEWRKTHSTQCERLSSFAVELQLEHAGSCRVESKRHVVGRTRGWGWAAAWAIHDLEIETLRTGTYRNFSELFEGNEERHTKCLYSNYLSCAFKLWTWAWGLKWLSIQQHQEFSRHRNEAAQVLQQEFCIQDDGILMILSE